MLKLDTQISGGVSRFQSIYTLPILPDFSPQPQDMQKAGSWIVNKIHSRVNSGMDVNERPFAPYSAAYAKTKGSAIVNLRGPGPGPHMIDMLKYRIDAGAGPSQTSSLEVGIFGDERKAAAAKATNEGASRKVSPREGAKRRSKNPKGRIDTPARYFLGLNSRELSTVQSIVVDSIKERIGR